MDENITIIDYYQNSDEDNRMEANPLEFARCKEIISRYLMKENLNILDCGGATGVFSFWLASQGHKVSLIDLTPKHIEIAKEHEVNMGVQLSAITIGDARDLPYKNETFDLVLLMGPLYHIIEKADRIKALREAFRVLKPSGRIICEVISRYASMVDGFLYDFIKDTDFISIMQKDITTGLHIDNSKSKKYFIDAYFHHSDELPEELIESGFICEDLIAVTSFANSIISIDEKLKDENYRKVLMDTIRLVEKEHSLMGISSHLIGIGTKL